MDRRTYATLKTLSDRFRQLSIDGVGDDPTGASGGESGGVAYTPEPTAARDDGDLIGVIGGASGGGGLGDGVLPVPDGTIHRLQQLPNAPPRASPRQEVAEVCALEGKVATVAATGNEVGGLDDSRPELQVGKGDL